MGGAALTPYDDRIMEVTKGNPLMVSMSGPLFNGPVSRVAAMVAAGLSEDEMKLAAKLDVEDFYAALDLKLETGQPLETIV